MVKAGSKRGAAAEEEPNDGAAAGDYEKQRAERIKENKERLHKLGILELTKNLNAPSKKLTTPRISRQAVSTDDPTRRSFRLKDMPPVSYKEKRIPKTDKVSTEDVEINIGEGENPEFYTEEHKLLGDCQNAWTLYVDGYDEDGQHLYDPDNGKSCHQCRQKTLGQRTACSNCKRGQGQFCEDCLYIRYGENVTETNENASWICPVCRGICNCSRCRRAKGYAATGAIYRKFELKIGYGENVTETNENASWICPVCRGICNCSRCRRAKGYAATGAIYRKVLRLGYKSVAHYLVKTRMHSDHEDLSSADSPSRKSTLPFTEFTNTLSTSQTDDNKTLKGEERTHCDGDDAYCNEEDVNE